MINQFSNILSRNFIFCDIGARYGLEEPWKSYRNLIDVISFEPDQEEFAELDQKKEGQDHVLPYALSNEIHKPTLNLTKNRGCSSLYEPNHTFLHRFPDEERFTVEKKEAVDATTLDNLYHQSIIRELDFLKMDVQGAELDILQGGRDIINDNILGIQIEVEFKPLYKSQPLFAEIDSDIREKFNFELFDIKKHYWKYKEGQYIGSKKGQVIFADALYFRDPYEFPKWCDRFNDTEANTKIFMACFMSILYGYHDYALCLLDQQAVIKRMGIEKNNALKFSVRKDAQCIRYSFKGSGKIWLLFKLLSKVFETDKEGWADSDQHLGSRKKFGIYY
jgi:FkbM family methyltransferase